MQLQFDEHGAWLQIVDERGRPRQLDHRATHGALRDPRQLATIPEKKREGTMTSPKRELLFESVQDVVLSGHKVLPEGPMHDQSHRPRSFPP